MCELSVLMSVYNEKEEDLMASIESVIGQTFNDFEFIIVNDNPENYTIRMLVESYAKKDNRIKIINNKINLGLAESMNIGASMAKGKYILRTDADDICDLRRFEKQYKIIKEYDYDLVCSDYYFIDEQGNMIDRTINWYDSKSIKKLLPYHNVIHHPTVLMKTSIFRSLNGYRNFPCAQDYDLWLRMVANNCSFYMVPEKLLYYRIRENSITGKNKFKQIHTIRYIRDLYNKYKKTGIDNFNYSQYHHYLKLKKVEDKKTLENYKQYFKLYHTGINDIKNKKLFNGLVKVLSSIVCSHYYRTSILEKIKFYIVLKFKI